MITEYNNQGMFFMKKKFLALVLSLGFATCVPASSLKTDAASRQLNIISTFGVSETSTYGVPNAFLTRYNKIADKVSDVYWNNFSITLNFTKPSMGYGVTSCAYECRYTSGNGNFDSWCMHVSNPYCKNSGPYHCTNCAVIKNDVFPIPNNDMDGYQMHFTAVKLCNNNSNGTHGSINGMHYPGEFILIRDTDYLHESHLYYGDYSVTYVAKTVAHEIGHAYGVQDHYSSPDDGNPYCIWGYYKDKEQVADNLTMCAACRVTIMMNGNRYNQS